MAFAAYSSPARAEAATWIGPSGTSGDWFNPLNWDTHQVPTSSTDASINNGGKASINSSGATARTVTLGANAGQSGSLLVGNGGILTVPPACGVNTDDPNTIFFGIYVGYGGKGNLSITGGGTVTSGYGYIGLLGGGTARPSNGTVTVDGLGSTWTFSGCPDARLFVGGNGNFISNPGGTALLNVTNGGAVAVNNYTGLVGVSVGLSGTLTGNGTLTINGGNTIARSLAGYGTLAPRRSLPILGNLVLYDDATTLCNVTPQDHDSVDLSGTAKLDGRLIVIMTGTFTRGTTCTTRFTLLHADGGRRPLPNPPTFETYSIQDITLNPPYTAQINYDDNNVYLDLVFNDCE